MVDNIIYEFNGGVGDILLVHEDRIIIQHKGVLNFLSMGMKGDKTIFYRNLTSVQLKKAGLLSGYLQFSLPGGKESTEGLFGATQDENTITFSDKKQNDLAFEIQEYINNKIQESKNVVKVVSSQSPADEIKKFKELLESGIITQEDFDLKKKQLLGL